MKDENQQEILSKEQIDSVIALYSNGKYELAINQIKDLNSSYPNVPFLFNLIGACYKALGRLEVAAKMFKKAVNIKPDYAEAYKNLGITLKDLGKLETAVESLKRAIEVDPQYVDAHYNLAITFKDLEQHNDAIKSYNRAIEINPNFAEAHNNLGNVFKDLEQHNDAIQSYERAIKINPNYPSTHNNLGNAFKDLERFSDAIKSYNRAIEINPNFAEAHNNLGNVFKDLEQHKDAIQSYEKAISCNQNLSEAHYNLGVAFKRLRQFNDAIKSLKNAIAIDPDFAESHNNLGSCFALMGQMALAIDCYKKALSIKPDYAEAHNSLGNLYNILGKVNLGVESFEMAISINPDFAEAHNSLGNAFKKLNKRDEALMSFERAQALKPELNYILGDILNSKMHLCLWDNLQKSLNEMRNKIVNNEKVIDPFNLMGLIDDPALQRIATELRINSAYPKSTILPKINDYPKHKKIRIGYFSADFREHPVGYLTAGLYEMHDRNHFEIHAFSFGPDTKDEMNLRIKEGVDKFHNVQLMSHKEITLLARSLEIDIAVDLTGLTAKSRTEIFTMSAAPVQLSYIGFLGTMGANYYDYLIADPLMIPQENQKYYSEKIVYLPSFQVNDSKDLPPEITLTRKDVGLPDKGFVFCCFNNTYKFTPTVFDSWARILKSVEGSVLIIYASNESSKTNLTKEIALRGIEPSRLIFGASLARPEYMARYRTADLFLDTHPYNAGTTASDALKMGLPMLTLKGQAYQARMGASIVTALNLPELITNTSAEYESLAIELAKNPDKLKTIKDKLASNLSTAPLYDTKLFTKNLESSYTKIYKRHHQGLGADHIHVE